jgi:hypothetical protein
MRIPLHDLLANLVRIRSMQRPVALKCLLVIERERQINHCLSRPKTCKFRLLAVEPCWTVVHTDIARRKEEVAGLTRPAMHVELIEPAALDTVLAAESAA